MLESNVELYLLLIVVLGVVNLLFLIVKGSDKGAINELVNTAKVDLIMAINKVEESNRVAVNNARNELLTGNRDLQSALLKNLRYFGEHQHGVLSNFQEQLKILSESNYKGINDFRQSVLLSLNEIRTEIDKKLINIKNDNSIQLEKIRNTVDEKLHKTLEERLGKSFELVSQRLLEVQKGIGEMQTLATGVGDLKKVLSNVKTRGVLGEIQLGNILEQLLTSDQYSLNVATIPDSRCHVEFAIKLPGRDNNDKPVWLPIDSKFPMDKYEHLQDAYESADTKAITQASKNLFTTVKLMAKDINDKYISPPHTTDFGILFLPTEGLYAEIARNGTLMQELQRDFKIMVAGPTNLAALLNSLQMGFRSLAIEKRTSEVWQVLGSVKTEFGKFGGVLDKVHTKLRQATDTIDQVGVRSRAIERQLRTVESLPEKLKIEDDGIQIEELINR